MKSMILIFIKSMVAGHARHLPDGRVVQVRAHGTRRGARRTGHQLSLFGSAGTGQQHTGRQFTDEEMKQFDHKKTADLFEVDPRLTELHAHVQAYRSH